MVWNYGVKYGLNFVGMVYAIVLLVALELAFNNRTGPVQVEANVIIQEI